MTLIEMIMYIALLAIILSGSVFSAYSVMLSQETTRQHIQSLNYDF